MRPKELHAAIKVFQTANRRRWNSAEKAKGCCIEASFSFRDFLTEREFELEIWDLVLDDDHDRYICPRWYPNKESEGHTVVYVGGVVIDWTAKQYHPNAPCPLVFVPRHGGDRKKFERIQSGKFTFWIKDAQRT